MRASKIALLVAVSLALGGCKSLPDATATGSIDTSAASAPDSPEGWRAVAAEWGPVYDRNPADARAAISYGRALRKLGQRKQALAVLQTTIIKNPQNEALLGEYGRALTENGDFAQALDVFSRAHTPERPNWRILMAQGAVLDQMGRPAEARNYYQTALKIAPDDPSILSNLGLSYALSNDLKNAEATLRRASTNPRAGSQVRQNLALVLALKGEYGEAQQITARDLGPQQAAENMNYLRGMVAQANNWRKLKQLDAKPKNAAG
jgi:Flp pilus assembly protein TadD